MKNMEKKIMAFICAILLIGLAQTSSAQTEQGNMMFGSQLANIEGTFQNKSNDFSMEISPAVAYFVRNNLAVGAMLNLGMDVLKDAPTTFTYGVGPWARYYFHTPSDMKFSKHVAYFIDGFVGIQGVAHNKGGGNTNGLGIKAGPGISYFITPNVSLDGSLNYNLVLGFGNATTANKLGLNLGFQIFLPSKKLKRRYQQELNSRPGEVH